MKTALSFLSIFLYSLVLNSQSVADSLQGFDLPATVMQAHMKNLHPLDLKVYVERAKRNFIKEKFNLAEIELVDDNTVSKYNPATTNNFPCYGEDFELYSVGTATPSGLGWLAKQGLASSPICSSTTAALYSNTTAVVIYNTPVNDANIGIVGTSPFGGNKVAKINEGGTQRALISNIFPVTSSNWLFNYAYYGGLCNISHGCCDDPYLMFNFYDCSNNTYIAALSSTVNIATASCVPTSTTNWIVGTNTLNINYTSNWQIVSLNLSAYIGSCLTLYVSASGCSYGVHPGYMYFDAKCSNGGILANNVDFLSPASNYTSCSSTATLAALPGFATYQWQGPSGSGVTGSTNSVVTTTVAGVYTLNATQGTITSTQTLNLSIPPQTPFGLSASSGTICQGLTTTLQTNPTGLSTYTWINSSSSQSISVSPTVTTTYSIAGMSIYSCNVKDSIKVTVLPTPPMSLTTAISPICQGQTVTLNAAASGISTFTWNTSSISTSISVSPTLTTVYSATGTVANGCKISSSFSLGVNPSPQLQTTVSTTSLCIGQSATISATAIPGTLFNFQSVNGTFTWVVTPTVTTTYSVYALTQASCPETHTKTITVYYPPQTQLIASSPSICLGQTASFSVSGTNIGSVLWNNGSTTASISVSPTLSSLLTVTVASPEGCTRVHSDSLIVKSIPQSQLVIAATEICSGQSTNYGVTGSNFYSVLWSNGSTGLTIAVSPTLTSVYSVTVTSAGGCSNIHSSTLTVDPLPQILISASSPTICVGQNATLTANSSANGNYNWSTNQSGALIIVSPTLTSLYTVTVTDTKGCVSNASLQVVVITCVDTNVTGLSKNDLDKSGFVIYPNPSDGTFEIRASVSGKGKIFNDLGQLIAEFYVGPDNNYTYKALILAKGIYFVSLGAVTEKVIVR